jgi:hypothetical protein
LPITSDFISLNFNDTIVAAHNTFNFADVQILNQETNNQKRKLTEAAQIWLHDNKAINTKRDVRGLRKCYFPIIKKFKKT